MSETHKYYWLKLNKDFFNSKRIKKLRKLAGGDTYTIIYLKMQLLSLTKDGYLEYTGLEKTFPEELALDIDEDPENVAVTVSYLLKCGLLIEENQKDYRLPFVQDSIIVKTSSALRSEAFRDRQKMLQTNKNEQKPNVDIDIDIDIDKDNRYNDSETTATAVVKAAAPSVFLTKMNSIFDDENWLKTLEGQTGIKLFSDLTIRKQLISWFDKRLIMSACNEEQGYKPRDAKKYLRNLLLPGRKTQNEFNDLVRRGIERAKRKQLINPQEEQTSGPSEYETVVNGVRYARRKESVPMSAPPQVYVCRRWSCIRNAWVAPDSWDFEEEMIARRRLGMPDKLLIQ